MTKNTENTNNEDIKKIVNKAAAVIQASDPVVYGTKPSLKFGTDRKSNSSNQWSSQPYNQLNVSNKKMNWFLLIFSLIFIIFSVIGYKNSKVPSNYVTTTGVVVGPNLAGSPNLQDQVIIDFSDQQQKPHVLTYTAASNKYVAGQKVQVAYDPSNPDKSAKNTSDKSSKYFGPLLIPLGILLLLVAVINLFRKPKIAHK